MLSIRRLATLGKSSPLRSIQAKQNGFISSGRFDSDQVRAYHATAKKEIVPVLAVGALLLIGRYSYKAKKRMDEDWEDYQWQLQQYERQRRKEQTDGTIPVTIGVDLGTLYMKLSSLSAGQPELLPTAQGDRYRFSGILETDHGDNEDLVTGRPALDKFYYQPEPATVEDQVSLPYRTLLKQKEHDHSADLVQQIVKPTVGEAMDRIAKPDSIVRTVLAVPLPFYNQHRESIFQQDFHDKSQDTVTVPDPVAAIWGAQALDLLPTPSSKEETAATSTLVVDVGGLSTSVSLVKQDKVAAFATLNNVGGESFVQQLVYRILKDAGDESFRQDVMSLALIHSSARSSAMELVHKTQTNVHIPFLFMGRKQDDPHLDISVSRTALEHAVQDHLASEVVPELMSKGQLSSSLPPPTTASALITSAVTKVLEDSGEVPTNIQHILVVGGGSKFNLFEQACEDGIAALMGPSQKKIVQPENSLRAELTALGAASLLPNFDYDYDAGLKLL